MQTMPFLEKNLEYLARSKSPVVQWLEQTQPDAEAVAQRLFMNRHGMLDYKLPDDSGLMEPVPARVAYGDWLPGDKAESSATFIVGSNLGYGLNHILVNTPVGHKVVLLEPRPEILLLCLGQTDFVPYFEAKKLFIIPPDRTLVSQTVQQADVQFLFGKLYLRSDLPSRRLGPEYALWTRLFKETLENTSVELATLRLKQDEMVGNELANFHRAMADGGITELRGTADGLSAVILGAGPSLALWGPKIARAKHYALLATSLQTLPACQAQGLKPHICMAIDYSRGMLKVFDRLDQKYCKDIPMLYSTKIMPEVLERYPGPTLPVWTRGGLATNVFKGREYILDAAGNVSVALYRLLAWMGVSQAILVGQDFAWRDGLSHVEGHHAAGAAHARTMKLRDRDGNELTTTLAYATSLRDLEADIQQLKLPTWNLYGGGAVIHGAKEVDMDTAIAEGLLASAPGSLDAFLNRVAHARRPRRNAHFEPRAPQWSSSLRSLQKRLEKLFKHPDRNLAEIKKSLNQLYIFLRQDPLYLPYLYNEIMDVAGLVRARPVLGLEDMSHIRAIIKRVQTKTRHMDRIMCQSKEAA